MVAILLDTKQEIVQPAHVQHPAHIVRPGRYGTVKCGDTVRQHNDFYLDAVTFFIPCVDRLLRIVVKCSTRCSDVIAIGTGERAVYAIDGAVDE